MRLSTETLHVTESTAGEVHTYFGVLDQLQFNNALGAPGEVTEGISVPIEAVMPLDVALLEAEGHRLEGSRVELARWVIGTDYSERQVKARGEVVDPRYGADLTPASFSVKSVVWEGEILIPSERQRVTEENWGTDKIDSLDAGEIGKYYPIIIGKPGRVSPGVLARQWITGSRARRNDRRRRAILSSSGLDIHGMNELSAVLAGHHVASTRVWVSTADDTAGERFGVYNTIDDQGQPVALLFATPDGSVPNTGASIFSWETTDPDGNKTYGLGRAYKAGSTNTEDAEGTVIDASYQPGNASFDTGRFDMFVGWYNDAEDVDGGEGGLIDVDGKLIRGAGRVLRWLLSRGDKLLDYGRFAAVEPLLEDFKLDFVIDVPVKPYDFVLDYILPLLPVTLMTGVDGIYPVVWRYNATVHDAVSTLDADVDRRIVRTSRVRVDSSKVANHFVLDYARSIRLGRHWATAELGAGPYNSDAPSVETSIYCKISQQRYRYANGRPKVIVKKLQTHVVYDDATARAILAWQARAFCLARREVSYEVPEKEWSWVEPGMVLVLNDSEVHISNWVVHVLDVQILDNDRLGLELLYLEDPPRDARRFG